MDEINLLDYVNIIVSHRWMILRNFFITILLTILISFILPKKYTAVTTLMPPQDQEQGSISSFLSEASIPKSLLGGNNASSEIFIEILKSRSVKKQVINRLFVFQNDSLPLYKILGFESPGIGILGVEEFTSFTANDQGIINIEVIVGARYLAADVANAFVDALDAVNQEKNVSRAKNSRIYLETQLHETENELRRASENLAKFQQKNRAISLEEQVKTSIQQVGEMKGQIIAKEVQIGIMLQTMTSKNPIVIQTKNELNELQKQYYELQFGENFNKSTEQSNKEFYLPFTDVPELGLLLADLLRKVKIQETVWTLLNQQYYQAKIQEAQDTPTVQVLDSAVPPIFRSSPNRSLLVIIFGILSILLSIIWGFGKEYLLKLDKRPEEKEKLKSIINELQKDLKKFKSKISRK